MNKTSNSHIAFNLAHFPGSLREEREEKIEKSTRKKINPIIFLILSIVSVIILLAIIIGIIFNKRKNKYNNHGKSIITLKIVKLFPNHIDGISGEKYKITMEYNRINNCLFPKNLTIFNSYKLNKTELIINIEQINNNNTKCLYNIYLTQIKATNIGDYNILTLSYKNKALKETISLNIKNGNISNLKWISGPTEGNVINPPNITFIPLDKYGNIYTNIFKYKTKRNLENENESMKNLLDSLTNSYLNEKILEKDIYLYDEKYIIIEYKSKKSGKIKVVSPYFKEEYEYRIKSGPVDFNASYIEITSEFEIGKNFKYIIYPKDIYGNDIDNLNINLIKLLMKNENKDNNVQTCNLKNNGLNKELKYNIIECENILNIDPDHNFELLFDNFRLKCIINKFSNNIIIDKTIQDIKEEEISSIEKIDKSSQNSEELSIVKEEQILNDEYIDTIKIIYDSSIINYKMDIKEKTNYFVNNIDSTIDKKEEYNKTEVSSLESIDV